LPDHGPDRERIADAIPRIAKMGQIQEPGKDVSYGNIAMLIAGYLCEVIKQKSWYTLIEEQIFEPLEMEHAIVQPADALLHRASVGHYIDPDSGEPYRTSFSFLPVSFAPACATCMMSATDLVTFARMHNNNSVGANGARILSAASATAMRTRTGVYQDPVTPRVNGLGWFIDEESGIISHGGGGPGIVSFVYPLRSFTIQLRNEVNNDDQVQDVRDRVYRSGGDRAQAGPDGGVCAGAGRRPAQQGDRIRQPGREWRWTGSWRARQCPDLNRAVLFARDDATTVAAPVE
jgi:CubicO group peptidase (beta-lactamase class C family)